MEFGFWGWLTSLVIVCAHNSFVHKLIQIKCCYTCPAFLPSSLYDVWYFDSTLDFSLLILFSFFLVHLVSLVVVVNWITTVIMQLCNFNSILQKSKCFIFFWKHSLIQLNPEYLTCSDPLNHHLISINSVFKTFLSYNL